MTGVNEPGAQPRVRSRQRLESGVAVEVVQWRGATVLDDAKAAGAQVERAGRADPAVANRAAADQAVADQAVASAPDVARVVRGPFVLEVTGTLPVELLAILAESAAPAR
jgi:hypothetical protein